MNGLTKRLNRIEREIAPKRRAGGRTYEQLEEWEKALWFIGMTQWTMLNEAGRKASQKLLQELNYKPYDDFNKDPKAFDEWETEARRTGFTFLEDNKEDIEMAANNTDVLKFVYAEYHDILKEHLTLRYKELDASLYGRSPDFSKGVRFFIRDGKIVGRKWAGNDYVDMSDQEIRQILG